MHKFDFDRFGNLYRKAASNPTTGQQNPLPFTPIEDSDINKAKIRMSGGGIAYVYAPYAKVEAGGNGVAGFVVGTDKDHDFEYTNVRTVIVKEDCKTVETSHPGITGGVRANDPRIVGRPSWWKAINIGF